MSQQVSAELLARLTPEQKVELYKLLRAERQPGKILNPEHGQYMEHVRSMRKAMEPHLSKILEIGKRNGVELTPSVLIHGSRQLYLKWKSQK